MKKLSMLAAIVAFGVSSMVHAEGTKAGVTASIPTCETPEYPVVAYASEEQGTVVINVLVDRNGKIVDHKMEKTSGYWRLDHASRRALNKCKFAPIQGDKLTAWQKVGYNWTIDS